MLTWDIRHKPTPVFMLFNWCPVELGGGVYTLRKELLFSDRGVFQVAQVLILHIGSLIFFYYKV